MATTVTYKGQTLTTVDNATVTLDTAGTWVEDDFTLTDVSGGGGTDYLDEVIRNTLTSYYNDYSGVLRESLFLNSTNLVSVDFPNVTQFEGQTFYNCQKLTTIHAPNLTRIWGNNNFRQCYALEAVAFPKWDSCMAGGSAFFNATNLKILDCGLLHTNGFGNNYFVNAPLTTLIFRYTQGVCPLNNTGAFNSTPFANGGAGGEIYVPSALINSYKAATNWSTVNGWGTITWKAIEGSYYATHYGDGTVIA